MADRLTCNHKDMTMRYCPDCGKPMDNTSLLGLLQHLETRVDLLENQREQWAASIVKKKKEGTDTTYNRGRFERLEAQLPKWRSWRDKLNTLLQDTHP